MLALENKQLQVRSESWMRNQQAIQEALVAEAGAGAEAAAIVQETNLRSGPRKISFFRPILFDEGPDPLS